MKEKLEEEEGESAMTGGPGITEDWPPDSTNIQLAVTRSRYFGSRLPFYCIKQSLLYNLTKARPYKFGLAGGKMG